MSGHEVIHLKYDGKLAIITLDNASKFNSLTQASYRRLGTLLREADANEDVVVTLLIGEGPFFSAYVLISLCLNKRQKLNRCEQWSRS